MTEPPKLPDIEKVKQTSAKVKELCQRADARILILDDLIAQLEESIRSSPLYRYRLNKAKRLLNIESSKNNERTTR
ncbi:hypothetical protein [Merismopedia glauca]|uniref:Uncharacterized protein n=1 Tax=Merismopedia glauca CCAP 1448/3 TaxID=1296344 RepID=A0A2T1C6W6_9CYAN|nr:hypothetical protein [Merismopedia glauca]PSB03984.1 hypothetical protein C7B64_05950 [Merismopedia glauca CCAP 1448/3]